jgi:murein DD-endopeptidase MepM/ murein hydrolase activator NlpD
LQKRLSQPDRRSYTLMIVPNRGNKVYRFQMPIRIVKGLAMTVGVIAVIATAGMIHYQYTLHKAQADVTELQQLRSVNVAQATQLSQLAKNTAELQDEMDKLNQLDAEVRRLLNQEELPGASRAGVIRPGSPYNGEGGPRVKPTPTELNRLVEELQISAKVRAESLANLKESLLERNARVAATPSIWPANGTVTSRYGYRWGGSDWHPGIDIAAETGTPVVATADGVVIESGWNGGYGRQVVVDHGYGITTSYGHNSELLVSVGQRVKKGDAVAYMGSTGFSTGPHVHYEVKINGSTVNPASFLH